MLNENKIRSLVSEYRDGDAEALDDLCRYVLPIINRYSESIWYRIENQAEFECRCIRQVEKAIKRFDEARGKISRMIIGVIKKEQADFLERRRRKVDTDSLDKPLYIDNDGSEVKIEVEDVLADIESRLVDNEAVNEKAALLAKGDSRRLAILNAWADGEFNDLELARVLAHSFGGQVNTHRTFIKRFRIECQERLATVS